MKRAQSRGWGIVGIPNVPLDVMGWLREGQGILGSGCSLGRRGHGAAGSCWNCKLCRRQASEEEGGGRWG